MHVMVYIECREKENYLHGRAPKCLLFVPLVDVILFVVSSIVVVVWCYGTRS